MKGYQSPELELTLLIVDDVIMASGGAVSTYDVLQGEHLGDDREW